MTKQAPRSDLRLSLSSAGQLAWVKKQQVTTGEAHLPRSSWESNPFAHYSNCLLVCKNKWQIGGARLIYEPLQPGDGQPVELAASGAHLMAHTQRHKSLQARTSVLPGRTFESRLSKRALARARKLRLTLAPLRLRLAKPTHPRPLVDARASLPALKGLHLNLTMNFACFLPLLLPSC